MHDLKYKITFFILLGFSLVVGCISHFTTTTENFKASDYANSYERGKNLTFNICGQCHYDASINRFTGKPMNDLPSFMGKIYSANLTHSAQFGVLNKYTDAELAYLLKTGITREGKYIPYMIRPNLADTDISNITIYLRSKDTAVLASDKVAGKTKVSLLGRAATKVTGKPLPYRKGIQMPAETDSLAYGRYLVDNLACYHCHSKSIIGLDYMAPEKSKGYLQGGMKFKTPAGKKINASNLTPDAKTGIGTYTKENFRQALHNGIRPNGDSLRLPMQRFPHLTTRQCDAIYAYLKSLKPAENKTRK
jgi:hypothetical protein